MPRRWLARGARLAGALSPSLIGLLAALAPGGVPPARADTALFAPAPGSPLPTGSDPPAIAVADFNGDGWPDLVASLRAANAVAVWLGDGAGGFRPAPGPPVPAGAGPFGLVAGDRDGDGHLDLAVADSFSGWLSVLLNQIGVTTTSLAARPRRSPASR